MKNTKAPTAGDLRVWWIPQVPMRSFYVEVDSTKEAKKIMNVLANYDIFQFENNIKPDYCNAGGLQMWEVNFDGEGSDDWCDWSDEDGNCIDDIDDEGNPK